MALQLMGLGARLVADDQTLIWDQHGWPHAKAPQPLFGLIEARGIGLLQADALAQTRLHLVVDLDNVEAERMPPDRTYTLCGVDLPLLHKIESLHFAASLRQYLLSGKAYR